MFGTIRPVFNNCKCYDIFSAYRDNRFLIFVCSNAMPLLWLLAGFEKLVLRLTKKHRFRFHCAISRDWFSIAYLSPEFVQGLKLLKYYRFLIFRETNLKNKFWKNIEIVTPQPPSRNEGVTNCCDENVSNGQVCQTKIQTIYTMRTKGLKKSKLLQSNHRIESNERKTLQSTYNFIANWFWYRELKLSKRDFSYFRRKSENA